MPVISRKDLVAKNKAGNGIRPGTPNAEAVRKLGELINKVGDIYEKEGEGALAMSLKYYGDALKTIATTRITPQNSGIVGGALRKLDEFDGILNYKDNLTGKTNYEAITDVLKQAGSSKEEFDGLLKTANDVLEMGLEKTVLKQVDPAELERQRQERERVRQEQERQRIEEQQRRARLEQERIENAFDEDKLEDLKKLLEPEEPEAEIATSSRLTIPEKKIDAIEVPEIRIEESRTPDITVKVKGKEDVVIPGKVVPAQVIPARTIPGRTIPANEDPTIEEAFEELYGSAKDFAEDGEDPVQMAVDEKGRVYEGREDILAGLNKKDAKLFVFKKDGSLPYALENRDGKLYASDKPISSLNQLDAGNGKTFEPRRSLDPRDIANIPSRYRMDAIKRKMEGPKEKKKNAQKWIDEARTIKREAEEWLEDHKKPPKLGALRTFQRWMYKLVTLGQGETSSYKRYQARKERWRKNIEYNQYRIAAADKRIPAMNAAYKASKDKIDELEDQLGRATSAYYKQDPRGQKKKIEDYRKRTEVRMEGIADIIKNGKVTQDNIFANTWLAEQSCKGKSLADSSALYGLMNYMVSRAVEDKILDDTISDPDYSRARNENEVEKINNGHAMERLDKDPVFRKLVQDSHSKPIDPDALYKEYKNRLRARNLEENSPINKLKLHRQKLIDDFGEKPVTKDCLMDVAKLNVLDDWIRRGEEIQKDLAEIGAKEQSLIMSGGDLSADDKARKKQLDFEANKFKKEIPGVIGDLGIKHPDDAHVVDYDPYLESNYVKAVEKVEKNLNKSAGKIDEAFKDLPEHQKKAWIKDSKQFKLDEITDMVNKVAGKKEPEKEAAGPQPQL